MINLGFDASYYLENNPDVAQAVADGTFASAFQHFQQFGQNELARDPNEFFDSSAYFNNNSDVQNAVSNGSIASGYAHFVEFGVGEDRPGTPDFDPEFYLNNNQDVANNYDLNGDGTVSDAEAFDHFVNFGSEEGRLPFEEADEDDGDGDGDGQQFTVGADALEGTSGDDVFEGPIQQAGDGSGAVTNTFDSGDSVNGGEGTDQAQIDLTSVVTGDQTEGPAISSTSNSVEQFFVRTQYDNDDNGSSSRLSDALADGDLETAADFEGFAAGNAANIDAENNDGVQQWWSTDGRADLIIEDIRERSDNVTFGFRDSDPGVSYGAFFDPASLDSDATDSSLTLTLIDQENPDRELADFPVNGVNFSLGGEDFNITVTRDDGGEELVNSTYTEFTNALNEALNANEALSDVQATLNGDDTITLEDAQGRTFDDGSYTFVNDEVPARGTLVFNQEVGAPIEGAIATNIVLDGVGRTSEGGTMIVGSMGTRDGIEQFDVQVGADSWVQALSSTNNILETVNVSHLGDASGSLYLGSGSASNDDDITSDDGLVVPQTTDDRLSTSGLADVRTFDAEGFGSELKVGARITDESFDKYLTGATEQVPFNYTLGDGGSNLHLNVDNTVAGDTDFALNIEGGLADDRVNLLYSNIAGGEVARKDSVSIDLAKDGNLQDGEQNIVELNTSTGVAEDDQEGQDVFNTFANVQTLVVADNNDTEQNIADGNMSGLDSIVIATEADGDLGTPGIQTVDTSIIEAEEETTITVSGRNQTLGEGESNDDQVFGDITITDDANENLELTLENTARVDGQLQLDTLTVDGTGDDEANSDVREVTLTSGGERNTSNAVTSFNGSSVNTLTLVGSQALGLIVSDMANLNPDEDNALTVNAEDLEGDLTLGIQGPQLAEGEDDTLTGTDGDNDTLTFLGALDSDTTVDEFENFQFGDTGGGGDPTDFNAATGGTGDVGGTFDFANTSGDTGNILIANVDNAAGLTLDGLSGGTTVNIGDTSTDQNDQGIDADVTLNGGGSGTINVNITDRVGEDDDLLNSNNNLDISGFATINLDIARQDDAAGASTHNVDLLVDDQVGIDLDGATITAADSANNFVTDAGGGLDALQVDGNTDSLVITGADEDETDNLVLDQDLPASLSTIDVSGYSGSFTATLQDSVIEDPANAGQVISANDDTVITASDEDIDLTLTELTTDADAGGGGDAASVDFNTTIEFTDAGTTANPSGWTIDNFVSADLANATIDNFSILDLSGLGVGSFAELTLTQDGADTDIVDGSGEWEITLTGVTTSDVAPSENFSFA
jgi:hypothetical protein